MKIPNTQELQQIALYQSSDIELKFLLKFYRSYTANPYSFLAIDATLGSDNLVLFQNNLLERK